MTVLTTYAQGCTQQATLNWEAFASSSARLFASTANPFIARFLSLGVGSPQRSPRLFLYFIFHGRSWASSKFDISQFTWSKANHQGISLVRHCTHGWQSQRTRCASDKIKEGRLLSGEFDRCSKHKFKQSHDETAKLSQSLVPRFITGIYYWNGVHPQGTTFAEAMRLLRSHRTSGSSL